MVLGVQYVKTETEFIEHYNTHLDYKSIRWHDILEAMRQFKINPLYCRRVLDLGCGDGRFSNNFTQCFNAKVLGVDYSSKRISKAIEKYPNISFIYDDVWRFSNQDFDLTIMFELLEHMKNPRDFLHGLKRPMLASIPINLPLPEHRHVFVDQADVVRQLGFISGIWQSDENFFLYWR